MIDRSRIDCFANDTLDLPTAGQMDQRMPQGAGDALSLHPNSGGRYGVKSYATTPAERKSVYFGRFLLMEKTIATTTRMPRSNQTPKPSSINPLRIPSVVWFTIPV